MVTLHLRTGVLAASLLVLYACTENPRTPARSQPVPTGGTATSAPASPSWRALRSAPAPVQEVAAAAVDGRLVVAGGLIEGGRATDLVQIFDPRTESWTRGPALPIALHHPAGSEFRGRFIVIGGITAHGDASNRAFALGGDRWVELPRLHHARGAAAAATVGSRIVVFGGISSGSHVRPVEVFDGSSWSDGAAIPTARDHLAAASDGRLAYAVGGRAGGRSVGAFEAYDPVADRWQRGPDLPHARSGFGAVSVGGRIVTAGGELPGIFGVVEVYDPVRRAWSRLPDMPTPRHGHGLAALGNVVYAAVGGNRAGLAPDATLESLQPLV